jgi:phosphate-selective porin
MMKWRSGLIVFTLLFLIIPTDRVQARTVEEILKDKGVISAEEYNEAAKDELVFYTPGKGLTATSADGSSMMKIGGYGQLIYRYTDYDASATDEKSDFDIRRFKIQVQGYLFSKNFGYKLQGDVSSGWRTEDVFIKYKFNPALILQAGQFKPAQARQELTSASRLLFPERSLANDTFNLGRDQGLQAGGDFAGKMVQYRLGISNGNGPNTGNIDTHHMLTGRVDINPFGAYKMDEAGWTSDKFQLNIGGSVAREKVTDADVGTAFDTDNDVMDKALDLDSLNAASFTAAYGSDLTWMLWTANLNATWMGASFAGEFYHLNADPDLGTDWDADGYYVQAGYQLIPKKLELGLRYSKIDSTDTNASEKFDKSELQFGANYYFVNHNLKLQSDVTLVNDDLTADNDDVIYRLQAQFTY